MTHFDANGSQVVCTATREERLALDDAPPIHFVAHEYAVWNDE